MRIRACYTHAGVCTGVGICTHQAAYIAHIRIYKYLTGNFRYIPRNYSRSFKIFPEKNNLKSGTGTSRFFLVQNHKKRRKRCAEMYLEQLAKVMKRFSSVFRLIFLFLLQKVAIKNFLNINETQNRG